MKYTIGAVADVVKDINTKYGEMKIYKIRFEEAEETMDYMISPKTDAPSVGDILEGTIGHNDFGAYFKKDKKPFTPNQSYASKPVANTDAMYVAYAKDLMIAYMNSISWDFTKLDEVSFNLTVGIVTEAAKLLQGQDNS